MGEEDRKWILADNVIALLAQQFKPCAVVHGFALSAFCEQADCCLADRWAAKNDAPWGLGRVWSLLNVCRNRLFDGGKSVEKATAIINLGQGVLYVR